MKATDDLEPMDEQKPIDEYTDKQLRHAFRCCVKSVKYSANDFREELFRRSQDRSANAMNRLTFVIAVATIVNVIVAIWQSFRMGAH